MHTGPNQHTMNYMEQTNEEATDSFESISTSGTTSEQEEKSDSESSVSLSQRIKVFKKRKRVLNKSELSLKKRRINVEGRYVRDSYVKLEKLSITDSDRSMILNLNENRYKKDETVEESKSETDNGCEDFYCRSNINLASNTFKEGEMSIISKLEKWNMFVNFSQCTLNENGFHKKIVKVFSEKWNPYEAEILDVAAYLSLLAKVAEVSFKETCAHKKVLGYFLPKLQLEKYQLSELLELQQDIVFPLKVTNYMEFTRNFTQYMPGQKVWRLFVKFCSKDPILRKNPYSADATVVRDFVTELLYRRDDHALHSNENCLRPSVDFYADNITDLSYKLGKYLKIGYGEHDLVDMEPMKGLLEVAKYLDGRIPLSSDLHGLIFLKTPQMKNLNLGDHDFTQYTAVHGSGFWEQELVKNILEDVATSALDRKKAAWYLGVTEDMISNALQFKSKDPECNMTLDLYAKKGFGTEAKFWTEVSTVEVLNRVRYRKLLPEDAAFMFGVSRSKVMLHVRTIKSVEEIENEKVEAWNEKNRARIDEKFKQPTELDKQILFMEQNIDSLSDYEITRLVNMKERKALLEQLGIAEDKNELKMLTLNAHPRKVTDYGTREKSSRIKNKLENYVSQASPVAQMIHETLSPSWVGKWYPNKNKSGGITGVDSALSADNFNLASPAPQVQLNVKEVISNSDYHKSCRFINSITAEFKEIASDGFSPTILPTEYSKIADSKVSSHELRAVDMLEDMICYGDSAGGVGVFLDGRSTTLKIHNEPVTRVQWLKSSYGNGILSSSHDGTVRLTDVIKQQIVVKYSWIQSGVKEQIGWIEPLDANNVLVNANRNSMKRIDLRTKKVETLFTLPRLDYMTHGYVSESDLLYEMSNDPAFGANIGVKPSDINIVSFCHESSVKLFDLRSLNQPVATVDISNRLKGYIRGISGANWSPNGEYFLICPVSSSSKFKNDFSHLGQAKTYNFPVVYKSSNLQEPIQIWAPKKGPYENACFSHYFGASWCPWQKNVYFTTAACKYNYRLNGLQANNVVVAIDGVSGEIVSQIGDDLDNSRYLIACHKTRNWVVIGNARGAGDLAIFKSAD